MRVFGCSLIALALTACSPMPGPWGLQPGIERVHDLSEISVREHPGTVLHTAATCNRLHWDDGIAGKLGVVATLGCTLGCSVISGTEPGVIRWCDIYYPAGSEYIRKHELKHCQGYADLF